MAFSKEIEIDTKKMHFYIKTAVLEQKTAEIQKKKKKKFATNSARPKYHFRPHFHLKNTRKKNQLYMKMTLNSKKKKKGYK
jgi:hypothetical protein